MKIQGTEYIWITGGRNFRANDLKTTEWIGVGQKRGRSIIGPDLPKAMNSQCMVSYKNTVLIIGGNTPGRTNSVLVYKFRDLNDFRYFVYKNPGRYGTPPDLGWTYFNPNYSAFHISALA